MAIVDLPDVLPVEDLETERDEDGHDTPWQHTACCALSLWERDRVMLC